MANRRNGTVSVMRRNEQIRRSSVETMPMPRDTDEGKEKQTARGMERPVGATLECPLAQEV